ncbi:MAG: AAA family ATPase [Fimbriimonadaceae bacterium]|nr:AAA family ATPase [Fimbriimonadaceae bacterium]
MRIDTLDLRNFRRFEHLSLRLDPHFTLLIGDNGLGKTSVLEALAVAAGIWLADVPDPWLAGSKRPIWKHEIRLQPIRQADRTLFVSHRPVEVRSTGCIGDEEVTWARQIRETGERTTNLDARDALAKIQEVARQVNAGQPVLRPVVAYYGAGRSAYHSRERNQRLANEGPARLWGALYDCLTARIRFPDLTDWFRREAVERGNRAGAWRPGFMAVRRAVLNCVPDADDLAFDGDMNQIVLSIQGNAQPFGNLSDGQRMMAAMVADIAIKAVTQNAHLLPAEALDPGEELPAVLRETPGLVLIDELDVHLHPRWQRRVPADLKRTFPSLQFVCTTHSPQVIGELPREQVLVLSERGVTHPRVAQGADSNWILDFEMDGAASQSQEARALVEAIEQAMGDGRLAPARAALKRLRQVLSDDTGQYVRLEASLDTLDLLCDEDCHGAGDDANNCKRPEPRLLTEWRAKRSGTDAVDGSPLCYGALRNNK